MPYLVPLIVSGLALLFGSAVEAATGYGSAVVALPVMELVFPSHMPALLILLGLPLIGLMVGVERAYIDTPAVVQVSSGLVFGTVLAIPVLALVSGRPLRLVFGFAALAALVPLTVMRSGVARTPPRSFAAGLASGFMGTATGMSGPPLAVVFAHEHGPTVRSTLGMVYGIGSAFSIGALLIARRIGTTDLWLAALLTVPVLLGFGAGRLLLKRVSRRFLHAAVLGVVGGCAVILFVGAV
ncbi:MAG: sulfite exporter TauE/SafE family protein [Actinobacteria bacterium]|nr:sulfite exporter TauE/SafE family protein [Actinomycetota bacterium]MBO0786588.1 sulfite exporter TauE/SafE family protein [Actinomycetota bacterium]MBO0816947.1 sulfite exporter TauE/SafE family protein [Actinomycetota bacterium]